MSVEQPPFTLVSRDGDFEVRDYPALVVAQVRVTGGQRQAGSRGFRPLAAYIFGANQSRAKIAMTAPVALRPARETIAMTAPVTQREADGAWIVRFTMPQGYALGALPTPDNPDVTLEETPPVRLAVLRFSGWATAAAFAAKAEALAAAAHAHGIAIRPPVTLAQYDPPWTLWFLRRNEVMAPLAP